MSRSRKKTPFRPFSSAVSEKQDKRMYNRRYRRVCRQVLYITNDGDHLPLIGELYNPWCMDKDGKRWFDPKLNPKDMRK
jgi:hypothetical protein